MYIHIYTNAMFYGPCMQCLGSADQIHVCARVIEGGGEGAPQWANMLGTIDIYIQYYCVWCIMYMYIFDNIMQFVCKFILKQYIKYFAAVSFLFCPPPPPSSYAYGSCD